MRQALNVVETYAVDAQDDQWLDFVGKWLNKDYQPDIPENADPETWGTSPEAQESLMGAIAMMDQFRQGSG